LPAVSIPAVAPLYGYSLWGSSAWFRHTTIINRKIVKAIIEAVIEAVIETIVNIVKAVVEDVV